MRLKPRAAVHARRIPLPKFIAAAALGLSTIGAVTIAVSIPAPPAHALVVFDPSNYAQNLLTATRALNQINNQISSLQNEARMLTNMAKNLSQVSFPELTALVTTLREIDALMGKAKGIEFKLSSLDAQFEALFPETFNMAQTNDLHVIDATKRLETAMAGFKQSMAVQSRIVEAIEADRSALSGLVDRSQNAEGGLQVAQTTNQLLALSAKQQFQLQQLMAAQYRAEAIEAARRTQAESDARAATKKFLGSGVAYAPH
jgi:P-type conjugative transfer protein TrbJ